MARCAKSSETRNGSLSNSPTFAPSNTAPTGCPLCAHSTRRILSGHPAFAAPGHFDVYDCEGCDTRFAWPLATSSAIYEQIYHIASSIPGYERYERYRALLPGSERPLDLLAATEDVYWGVRAAVCDLIGTGRKTRILEIGSGMGYLTYALHRAGFDVLGVDHSEQAVALATSTFGSLFRVSSAESLATGGYGQFDVVISTEVIEHLTDPVGFMRDAASCVAASGRLILTTPNRDIYPRQLAWHTDPAPVHLWWFSKASIRRMAWICGLQPSFVDFSPFYGRAPRTTYAVSKPPSLDAEGKPIFRDSLLNTVARRLISRWPALTIPIARIFLARLGRQVANENFAREGLSLCAVLRPTSPTTSCA